MVKRNINQNTGHMPIQSSSMRSAGYDAENGNMHVRFNDGGHYVYHGITPEVYQGLMMSSSKGGFLSNNVKGKFAFTKL